MVICDEPPKDSTKIVKSPEVGTRQGEGQSWSAKRVTAHQEKKSPLFERRLERQSALKLFDTGPPSNVVFPQFEALTLADQV